MRIRILVFSDLDGTLLDHHSYSFESARPALHLLREKRIPLIICSSKTRAEIESIRAALANTDPFISENGGAVFIPEGYFAQELPSARRESGYHVLEFGTPYPRLREVISELQERLPGQIRGFGDLAVEKVMELTGLSAPEAALAKKREYDEPFLLTGTASLEAIQETAGAAGLKISQGGRFFHLTGDNDKGKAVRLLRTIYAQAEGRPLKTIGLGDSPNDLPLLENVDFPVLVQKPGGRYDPSIRMSHLIRAPGEGPDGWRAAVLDLVGRLAA
ncbi:MAG TPA: HAD-IIB family hydrolase [Candidatus Desulfaltia sp.]|nr:HAD-IIB family hydrolase [Candidatus Desulfaltia sp.]